jgi:hypothetical protein
MAARLTLLLLFALALAGCGDGSGPSGDARVAIRLVAIRDSQIVESPGVAPVYRCTVDLEAKSTGSGPAEWLSATQVNYIGIDRAVPHDSQTISYAEVQARWGGTGLLAHETRQASWQFNAAAPFSTTVRYRYRAFQGPVRVDSIAFACGPIPSAGSAPPTLTIVSVSPTVALEPGDTIRVEYTAEANAGLWETAARIRVGTCTFQQDFAERFALSTRRVLRFVISPACATAAELSVELRAVDIALREDGNDLHFDVADRTRPVLNAHLLPGLSDIYFPGDSVLVAVQASDNNALRRLVWTIEPQGVRDSVDLSGPAFIDLVKVPIHPDWSGAIRVRLYARDAGGLVSDTISLADSILVHPLANWPVVTDTLPGSLKAIVIDAPRDRIYALVSDFSRNRFNILALSRTTLAPVDSVALPVSGSDMDLTASGDSLVVAVFNGALGIVDLRAAPLVLTRLFLSGIDTTVPERREQIRTTSTGHAMVATGARLLDVDLATGFTRARGDAGNAGSFNGVLARSHDHAALVLNAGMSAFQRYDPAADTFGPLHSEIPSYWTSGDSTGARFAVGVRVYDSALNLIVSVQSPSQTDPSPSVISSDGAVLYHTNDFVYGSLLMRSDATSGVLLDGIRLPWAPGYLVVSPDGKSLIVANIASTTTFKIAVITVP